MGEDDWIDEPAADDRSLDERIADMKKSEANQAPPWFFPLLGGVVVWTVAGLWLQHKINYPHAYGYLQYCPIRGCWVADLIHSPVLLEHPNSYALALFAWYMSMLAAIVWIIVHAARRTPHAKYLITLGLLAACVGYIATDPGFQRVTWNS